MEALQHKKNMRLYHAFLTLWVRSDKSVASNQPWVGWSRTDMRSVPDFSASISTHWTIRRVSTYGWLEKPLLSKLASISEILTETFSELHLVRSKSLDLTLDVLCLVLLLLLGFCRCASRIRVRPLWWFRSRSPFSRNCMKVGQPLQTLSQRLFNL